MSEEAENIDVLIDAYLDGRMEPSQRSQFEERMKKDPDLHAQVMSATHAVALVQKALGAITPGNEFEDIVNSKILSITQSGQNIAPAAASNYDRLSKDDPDAKLLSDPDEEREQRRLVIIGIIAALLFALAAGAVIYSVKSGLQKPAPEPVQTPKQ